VSLFASDLISITCTKVNVNYFFEKF